MLLRLNLTHTSSSHPSYEPGEMLWGAALGRVVTAAPDGAGPGAGELVEHRAGWREYAPADVERLHAVRVLLESG